jgi:hypothetical protein
MSLENSIDAKERWAPLHKRQRKAAADKKQLTLNYCNSRSTCSLNVIFSEAEKVLPRPTPTRVTRNRPRLVDKNSQMPLVVIAVSIGGGIRCR